MPEYVLYALIVGVLVSLELLYFKMAEHYQIIDKPNQRSSHSTPTIRGGGIVFLFSVLAWFCFSGFQYPWFVLGTVLIAFVSFIDDLGEQPARVRLAIQFIAFSLMGWEVGIASQPLWLIIVILVVGVGTINAFNFMDGINGITGVYSLVNLISLYWITQTMITFTDSRLVIIVAIGVIVFLFFNFRKRARCFAGDVGSVTIAFVQLFFVISLIQATGNFLWCFLFLVYGIDSVITIIYRLKNRENIFKAHRTHLYQYFSNELRISHLWVSTFYGLLQLITNMILLYTLKDNNIALCLAFVALAASGYIIVREYVLHKIGIKGIID